SYDPAGIEIKLNVIVMVRRKHRELTFNVRPLRPCRERPCGRGANEHDELAAPHHSITSSARNKVASGIVRPIFLAVFRFKMSSNFVGCSIGKSDGAAPLASLSTYSAARANKPVILAPYDTRPPASTHWRNTNIAGMRRSTVNSAISWRSRKNIPDVGRINMRRNSAAPR